MCLPGARGSASFISVVVSGVVFGSTIFSNSALNYTLKLVHYNMIDEKNYHGDMRKKNLLDAPSG